MTWNIPIDSVYIQTRHKRLRYNALLDAVVLYTTTTLTNVSKSTKNHKKHSTITLVQMT